MGDWMGSKYDSVSSMLLLLLFHHQTGSFSVGLPVGWEYNIHKEKNQGNVLNYKRTNVMKNEYSFQVLV